ncbi:neural cell adhesion molecule L1-like protein isoform X8 [Monodelphis domestica]|uniref:neural cell adhesion molecule L1-like protein isoform X8 n=1 Tax=Monodelphis domestica TaxID=13616 RepID=UPI0024E1CE67|nr:neural cell adhesion molecule L1-like protein isoform X8 [Monodelphis domestica]XP_056660423.1 neural cell adhesion molecule L1-like protein isoform X8 [Monodelphis domestica]
MKMQWKQKGYIKYLLFFMLKLTTAIEIPISVKQVPTITEQSTVQVAFPFDEYFQFVCEAKGNPEPTFHWTKNEEQFSLLSDPRIISSNNTGTFKILNEGHITHFQGKYRCFASNELGTAMSDEIEFIVPNVPKFPKEKIEPLEVEEGNSIVLHCNPPKGIPPLHIYWMNIDLQHIPQDERVYMSQKGDLYFANVEENDSRNDYCCFAAFPRLRTIVQKMPMKLTVNSSNVIKQREPRMLLPPETSGSHSSITIIKGGTLLLECFAEGLPTPQITWKKVGEDLPKGRETQENFGKTLKIEQVTHMDKGHYHCMAKNYKGTAIHEFRVTVEEPPRWTKKPESAVYSIGSNGILLCEAEGEPAPEIEWKINGLPIDKEHPLPGIVFFPGEISFSNVQLNHTGVYQCEATNVHGKILATANINVLDIAPLMQTPDDEGYAAVVGYSAFLLCEVFASPPAVITWQRPSKVERLEGSHYTTYPNGTLEIKETTKEDAGPYTCWVKSPRGEVAVTAHLTIRDATNLTVSPLNPHVIRSHLLVLHCDIECDSHLKHSLKLSWSKDGEALEINGTEDVSRIIIDGDKLTISNITLEDEGLYACLANTALDRAMATTQVTILDVPDPPENVYLSERQNRSVRLSWEAGDNHNSAITEFIIEFEGNRDEPGKWAELTKVQGNETTALLSLAPYVRYQFRVRGVNAVGRSIPSSPSDYHETPPAAPDKNPENIRVEASQPKEMFIKWEPLNSMEQNGPGLEYRVTWRQQGVPSEWSDELATDNTLRVMTSSVFTPYDVKVQAINQLGSGPEPQTITVYSGEDYPDAAPLSVTTRVINSTLINVTWDRIPKERVHGHLKGYQINWWKTKSRLDERKFPKEIQTIRLPGDRSYGMVPSLDPFSEFKLTVLAYNSKGAGPESSPISFQTPEGVPEQPNFLKVIHVDKNTVVLSWGLPKKAHGNLTGYSLQYQIINDTDEIGELKEINITNPSKLSWRVPDLNSTTKYKFYLRACTSKGCGKPVTEEGCTTGEGTYAGLYDNISTQGWFIGLMCAIALLTLILLTICFVRRNKGGKYSVKEKEDLHPDPEVQSGKDETFGEYSDSDEKPLKGSLQSLNRDLQATESADSLVDYGEGDHGLFNEDGSFIGAYTGSKEKGSVESTGSSMATFPLRA